MDGSRATTAPLPPWFFSPFHAAFCAAALRVVTTLPPDFALPVIMSRVLRKKSRSSLPVRMPSSMDSSWLAPKAWEAYPVTGAHIAPFLYVRLYFRSLSPEVLVSVEPVIGLPSTMMSPRGVE